jgi:hypothetical protein
MPRHVAGHARLRRELRARADLQVAGNAYLARQDGEVADLGAARDADLSDDQAARPDPHIVPDLDEIIDLAPGTDQCIRACASINRAVGADLHIVLDDHPPQLRHLFVAFGPGREPEPVLSDPYPRMEDGTVADDAVAQGGAGADVAVVADHHVVADDRVGADAAARADLGTGADHRPGIDLAPGP